jgi:hypothetical protein
VFVVEPIEVPAVAAVAAVAALAALAPWIVALGSHLAGGGWAFFLPLTLTFVLGVAWLCLFQVDPQD